MPDSVGTMAGSLQKPTERKASREEWKQSCMLVPCSTISNVFICRQPTKVMPVPALLQLANSSFYRGAGVWPGPAFHLRRRTEAGGTNPGKVNNQSGPPKRCCLCHWTGSVVRRPSSGKRCNNGIDRPELCENLHEISATPRGRRACLRALRTPLTLGSMNPSRSTLIALALLPAFAGSFFAASADSSNLRQALLLHASFD